MRNKLRVWQKETDEDPGSGLVNLFDVWIVVVVALILALLKVTAQSSPMHEADETQLQLAGEAISEQTKTLPRFRKSDSEMTGQGELLGTAYRLQNGEIVYVPKSAP